MKIAPGVIAVGLAGSAVVAPGTAWADQTLNGHYVQHQYDQATGRPITSGGRVVTDDWYFTPCGAGCAALVAGGEPSGVAHLGNGQWTLDSIANVACPDGTRVDKVQSTHSAWDANTLAGTQTSTFTAPACGTPKGFSYTLRTQLTPAP